MAGGELKRSRCSIEYCDDASWNACWTVAIGKGWSSKCGYMAFKFWV